MKPLVEEANREPPRRQDVHTEEECDRMLALDLDPKVRDAWLDERLSCMQALVGYAMRAAIEGGTEEPGA
jgi:hypothetical protein